MKLPETSFNLYEILPYKYHQEINSASDFVTNEVLVLI
jgi:hypothetical protein